MNKEIILNTDLKDERDIIIKDTINSFYRRNFLFTILKSISEGYGFGDDIINIIYWRDLDEYDRQDYDRSFEKIGMELSYFDDEIVIPYDDLYYYLEIAFKRYVQEIPQQKEELEKYTIEIKVKFNEYKSSK